MYASVFPTTLPLFTVAKLINYTLVVLVFVTIMMVIVTLLDLAFGTAVGWVFGGSGPTDS